MAAAHTPTDEHFLHLQSSAECPAMTESRDSNYEIEVEFDHDVAVVDATFAEHIVPALSYGTISYSNDGGVVRGHRVEECLGRFDQGTFRFPAKLAKYVEHQVSDRGGTMTYRGVFPFASCQPDVNALASLTEPNRSMLANPGTQFGALICGPDPWNLIPVMMRMYARYRIVLPVRNRTEATRWLHHLRGSKLPQRICDDRELAKQWGSESKVYVGSFAKLDICGRHDFDVVIVPDAAPLADNLQWDHSARERNRWDFRLLRDPSSPAFGFLPRTRTPSRGEILRLGTMFGQTLLLQ
jgi:hypothetical protein